MSQTLQQLRLEVRRRANMENSTFVTDTELTSYINLSYAELYDILVSRFEDYYSKRVQFSLPSGANQYSLPADLYKVRGLDWQLSPNDWATVGKWNFEERNRINRSITRTLRGVFDRSYRVMGSELVVLPESVSAGNYQLWYIPKYTPLVNNTDTTTDILDFDEYIIVDSAIKCLQKEESDVQVLLLQKQALKDRIEAMAANRDTRSERVSNVRDFNDGDFLLPRF